MGVDRGVELCMQGKDGRDTYCEIKVRINGAEKNKRSASKPQNKTDCSATHSVSFDSACGASHPQLRLIRPLVPTVRWLGRCRTGEPGARDLERTLMD